MVIRSVLTEACLSLLKSNIKRDHTRVKLLFVIEVKFPLSKIAVYAVEACIPGQDLELLSPTISITYHLPVMNVLVALGSVVIAG